MSSVSAGESSNPLLSIIIPVFNAEDWIEECLASCEIGDEIPFEVIVVDDGSSDSSPHILAETAGKNRRIKVIRVENGGVSRARNIGIDAAEGEWITFLDADDRLDKEGVLNVLNRLLKCSQSVVYSMLARWEDKSALLTPVEEMVSIGSEEVAFGNRALKSLLTQRRKSLVGRICRAFIQRGWLKEHGIRFIEGVSMSEDYCFNFDILRKCDEVLFIGCVTYHARINPRSTTHRYMHDKRESMEAVNERVLSCLPDDEDLIHLEMINIAETLWEIVSNELMLSFKDAVSVSRELFSARQYREAVCSLNAGDLPAAKRFLMGFGMLVPSSLPTAMWTFGCIRKVCRFVKG